VKIRAASEGRKLKEVIADLLEKDMDTPAAEVLPLGELPHVIDPRTGFRMARSLNIQGFITPNVEQSQAIIERTNEEENLRLAGLLR